MIKIVFLLSIPFIFTSCGGSSRPGIVGTWDYSRPIIEQNEIRFSDEIESELKDSKASKIWKNYELEGIEHFYLKFDEDGVLTEYKAGMAIEFDYRIANDTIFTDLGAYYKIINRTPDEIILKKIRSGNTTTYKRVEIDLSDHEMAN